VIKDALAIIGAWFAAAFTAGAFWAAARTLLKRRAGDQPVPGADQALALTREAVTWDKPRTPTVAPAAAHHRGNHMVIDTWECGCIYTWTRAAGWVHDFVCTAPDLGGQDPDEWLKGLTS
jgi:hypothetical protein